MGTHLDWKWHATDDCINVQWLPVALHDKNNHTNPLGTVPLLVQQMVTLLVLFFFRKTPPNPPRTRPGEGMRNYERAHNQSEMAAILRGEGNQRPSTPARNVRHLQRSELWWWQQGCGASCCRDWWNEGAAAVVVKGLWWASGSHPQQPPVSTGRLVLGRGVKEAGFGGPFSMTGSRCSQFCTVPFGKYLLLELLWNVFVLWALKDFLCFMVCTSSIFGERNRLCFTYLKHKSISPF